MFNWLKRKNYSQSLFSAFTVNGDRAKRDAKAQIREGYIQNAIVYRCVNIVASAASSIDVNVYTKGASGDLVDADKSFVAQLVNKPNTMQGRQSFVEAAISSYMITGNTYPIGLPYADDRTPKGRPVEMFILDPASVRPYGDKYVPDGFEVDKNNGTKDKYPMNSGKCSIAHFKNYNPTDPRVGLSPLYAAGAAVDVHNNALNWNASLLENGARPSGFLTMEDTPNEQQVENIKQQLEEKYTGSSNAGKPMVLYGGLKFESTMLNMKDLEFSQAIKDMAVLICAAFGVPFQLVVQGESSLNNMKAAHEHLYMDAVIPTLQGFYDELARWLSAIDGQEYIIKLDLDSIPALEEKRERKRKSLREDVQLGLISRDEAREAMGYEKRGGMADSLLIPSTLVPLEMSDMPDFGGEDDEQA